MSRRYTMLATIPYGPDDLGAEVECRVTFTYTPGSAPVLWGDSPDPGSGALVEFIKAEPYCNGRPSPYYGAFADLEQQHLNDLAANWLDGDGYAEALAHVEAEDERAREYAAELRAERRREP